MEINLQSNSPASRRANELARELITERATDQATETEPGYGSLVHFSATLTRVLNEVLADAQINEAAWERIAALTAALSMIAGVMATAFAHEMAEIHDWDRKQALEDVLRTTFQVLAENEDKNL